MIYEAWTKEIIKAFYEVHNTLGYGFLEQVYQNALFKELKRRGIPCEAQYQIPVYYKGELVGRYVADIVVDGCVILELKAVSVLREEHELQLVNYLKATDYEVGLLLNFGRSAEVRRKIFTADRKKILADIYQKQTVGDENI
ncbi:GxxExxY protein [Bacteroides sp.]